MRRRVLTILLFLLLGAILNIAVAWGLAYPPVLTKGDYGFGSRATRIDDTGRVTETWYVNTSRAVGTIVVLSVRHRHRIALDDYPGRGSRPEDVIPHWAPVGRPSPEYASGRMDDDMRAALGYGFPFPSLWYELRNTVAGNSSQVTAGCVDLGPSTGKIQEMKGCRRRLPLYPIGPAFAFNALVYAVMLWSFYCTPFVLRRRIRLKRGRCPKCGYDLRGDLKRGCPECGWNRQPEATE